MNREFFSPAPAPPLSFFFSDRLIVGRRPVRSRPSPSGVGLRPSLERTGTDRPILLRFRRRRKTTYPLEESAMSTQLDSDSLTEAARAIVRAYYYGTRQELDATAERLRSLLGWDSFAPDSTTDACEVCDCGDQGLGGLQ